MLTVASSWASQRLDSSRYDVARSGSEVSNALAGQTKTLRLDLDQHTRGLSSQVQALNQSAHQFRIA